ncbi:hypothetical protein NPIL_702141 [Nephila pilipes]|uniref:Uncharacterized protein n=1 Tax=Nephila pilipes TaxID=299642 RepID=A0A8X6NV20_NEPPI|nr:hypothetical protein NPIL_696371 [Nephila pilipes]GFT63584.1 hypothetical protein NPIL_702141 [Nephila pilipes]
MRPSPQRSFLPFPRIAEVLTRLAVPSDILCAALESQRLAMQMCFVRTSRCPTKRKRPSNSIGTSSLLTGAAHLISILYRSASISIDWAWGVDEIKSIRTLLV